jgi:hypothetical protein
MNLTNWSDVNDNDNDDDQRRINRVIVDEVDFFSDRNDKSSSPDDDVSMKINDEIYDPHCNLAADHVNVSSLCFLFFFFFTIFGPKIQIYNYLVT